MVTVIGLDVGHSAVKMVVRGTNPFRTCFPSLVCSAIEIPGDTRAEQTAQDTVTVGEASFFVGETAYFQRDRHNSGSEMGLHAEWVSTAQYEALVRGALKKAELAGNDLSQVIIINGLPQANLANTKNNLDALIKRVAPQATFKTLSQPMGAFYTEMLDENGDPIRGDEALEECWVLIDIGYYTSDLVLMDKGRRIEKASGSSNGVSRIIADSVRLIAQDKDKIFDVDTPIEISPQRLMEAIEKSKGPIVVKNHGILRDVTHYVQAAISSWLVNFFDTAKTKVQPYIAEVDGIIVSGGGAPLLFDGISSMWPRSHIMADSRFSIAEGFARFGMLVADSMASSDDEAGS